MNLHVADEAEMKAVRYPCPKGFRIILGMGIDHPVGLTTGDTPLRFNQLT